MLASARVAHCSLQFVFGLSPGRALLAGTLAVRRGVSVAHLCQRHPLFSFFLYLFFYFESGFDLHVL